MRVSITHSKVFTSSFHTIRLQGSSTEVSTSVTSEVMFLVSFELDFITVNLKIYLPICNTSLQGISKTCHKFSMFKIGKGLVIETIAKPLFLPLVMCKKNSTWLK